MQASTTSAIHKTNQDDKTPPTLTPSSILFQSADKRVIIFDIPRSIEESQTLPGKEKPTRRIRSAIPPAVPFTTPEPKTGNLGFPLCSDAPAAQGGMAAGQGAAVAELMTAAAVQSALSQIAKEYSGPFHLPRWIGDSANDDDDDESSAKQQSEPDPPGSSYLEGSVAATRQTFLDTAPKFDLIVIDPPWPNRSARRLRQRHRKGGAGRQQTRGYATADDMRSVTELLASLPIPAHLAPHGLVAVWITNKPRARHIITSPTGIFAAWGLELTAEWTWLKVAASGAPLYALDAQWRKPWETLLVARPRGAPKHPALAAAKVIVAVPDVHSRKPSLRALFADVLGPDYLGLEIFARNLTAGWWSWGDEVLKFQGACHWQSTPGETSE